MTRHRDYLKKPGATLWSCATLLTLGVYAGLTAWLLYNPTTTEAQAAPAAMMIELAPTPEAQVVKENLDVAPDTVIRQQSSAPSAKPLEKLPKKTEPEKKKPPAKPPVPRVEQAREALKEQKDTSAREDSTLDKAEREQAEAAKSQAATNTTAPPKADARPADRTAAAQSSAGAADPALKARWQSLLLAHLEKFKRYPQNARERGDRGNAYLQFEIDDEGKVLNANIVRSSGFAALDRATLDMISRASPVPRPPQGSARRFTVPVVFAQ